MYKLRELEAVDVKTINLWRNDKRIIDNLAAPFRFINIDVDENWFSAYMNQRKNTVRCSILDDNKLIGLVSLTNIDNINQTAQLHIMIGDTNYLGKGAGTFDDQEMINHAFNNLNLQRIELEVLKSNERALGLYKKCGFLVEGRKERCIYKNGTFQNMLMMAKLK